MLRFEVYHLMGSYKCVHLCNPTLCQNRNKGRDGLRAWNWHMHTEVYGMIGQQEPAG